MARPESYEASILGTANELKKGKARSLATAREHLKTVEDHGREVVVGLLGDSMIERMKTTGQCESLQSWPSETMASDSDIQAMNDAGDDTDAAPLARIQGVANFGCGGDKINNVLYRVMGDTQVESGLKGLAQELNPSTGGSLSTPRKLKLWVIHAGTNNLSAKHGLRKDDLELMRILLKTLHHLSRPGTKFLVTGLFYRKNIDNRLVDEANEALQSLVASLDQELSNAPHMQQSTTANQSQSSPASGHGNGTFEFLPAPQIDDFSQWLEDNVHLHPRGYQKWMQTLLPKVHEILRTTPTPRTPTPGTPGGGHFGKKDEVREYHPTDSVMDGQAATG